MPIYDVECPGCGWAGEVIANVNDMIDCPLCGATAKRIISVSGVNTFNEDAEWIRSVREVVDKEGGPHCQEFLTHPTRENLHTWMQVEGVRHMDPGERPSRPPPVDMDRITKDMMSRRQARERIEVR